MSRSELINKLILELSIAGSPTAEIDARVIVCYSLSLSYENIFSNGDEPITNAQYAKIRRLVRRRKKGEPIAYIVKNKEFYGYIFYVNKNVLIPRPESEMLVDSSLKYLLSKKLLRKQFINIIDVGTGSGCLIISIIKELLNKNKSAFEPFKLRFFASDISKKSLYVARKNAILHKVNQYITFYQSDLFSNTKMPNKYDLIIANLPYVPDRLSKSKTDLSFIEQSISFEPKIAIYAKDNGTKSIKRLIYSIKDKINSNGLILIEADPRNINELIIYTKKFFGDKVKTLKDISNQQRVIVIMT